MQEGGILEELGAPFNCSLTQACYPHKGRKTVDRAPCMALSYCL